VEEAEVVEAVEEDFQTGTEEVALPHADAVPTSDLAKPGMLRIQECHSTTTGRDRRRTLVTKECMNWSRMTTLVHPDHKCSTYILITLVQEVKRR
jgi:hypothetical protein